MREQLYFDGLGWPAAYVLRRQEIPNRSRAWDDPRLAEFLIFDTRGKGRRYSIEHPEGWWRDFAEIQIDDEKKALAFLARRGDPFGELKPGGPVASYDWLDFIQRLQIAASAWESEVDANGISAIRAPHHYAHAETFLTGLKPDWTSQLEVIHEGGLMLVTRAKVLAAYMTVAAIVSLRQRLPMRRCGFCHSWFTLHHGAALHCSPSCRAAEYNRRNSIRVIRAQDHHAKGNDPLASALENPGAERQAGGDDA